MTDKERVELIRNYLKINKKTFADILGYSHPQNYTKYLTGTSNLSFSALKSLKEYNDDFDTNWIITGKGTMLLSGSSPKAASELELENEYLKNRLKDKEALIQNQQDLIEALKK